MYKNKTFLAIIPARGGSKRLPRKNLLELVGKPLISWSIEAGLQSKHIDKVIVTSDDEEILNISRKFATDILKRPKELASDTATTVDVIKHTIENVGSYDYIVLLQPTSPLRNFKHIDEAIELLKTKETDAVISVCEMDHSPLWSNTLPADGSMVNFKHESAIGKRSQDLEKYYRINGAMYICKTEKLLEEESLFLSDNIFAYVMSRENSIDIDEEIDFKIAESLIQSSDYKSLVEHLMKSYIRQGFGRLLKSEVDLIMFEFALKLYCTDTKPHYMDGECINYFMIGKDDIYELSKKLKITQSKVTSSIEQLGLLQGILDDELGKKDFMYLLSKQRQKKENIDAGYITVQVSNRLLKQFIESKMLKDGHQVDYGQNKEIIHLDFGALVSIFEDKETDFDSWIKKQNKLLTDDESKKIKASLTKEKFSKREFSKDISKILLSKVVGESGDVIVDEVFKIVGGSQ